MSRLSRLRSMSRGGTVQKGFITGIALSLLVAVGIFSAVHSTSAQSDDQAPLSLAADTTTATSSATAATANAAASPAVVPPPVATAPVATTPAAPAHTNAYVGLGDSVAAGLGLPTWTTATSDDKSCGRSPYSYVFEVGRQLKRPHAPYACSGATTASLSNQLGVAYNQGIPAVISVTIGANDLNWSKIIQSCYVGNCQAYDINTNIGAMQKNLLAFMQQVQDRSAGSTPPRVILTGYYNPLSQQCVTATGGKLAADEITWLTGAATALNTTIESVAKTYGSFARFAPVDYTGHDACSATPWVLGLTDPVAPLHPNAAGQQAIATSVVKAAQ